MSEDMLNDHVTPPDLEPDLMERELRTLEEELLWITERATENLNPDYIAQPPIEEYDESFHRVDIDDFLDRKPDFRHTEIIHVRSISSGGLTKEMEKYFQALINACFSSTDERRQAAFSSLEFDPNIFPMVSFFAQFVFDQTEQNVMYPNMKKLQTLMSMTRHLILNEYIPDNIKQYLHQFLPAVMTCIVCSTICAKHESEQHCQLRSFAAELLKLICDKFSGAVNRIQERAIKVLQDALRDSQNKESSTIYGILFAFKCFGVDAFKSELKYIQTIVKEQADLILSSPITVDNTGRSNSVKIKELIAQMTQLVEKNGASAIPKIRARIFSKDNIIRFENVKPSSKPQNYIPQPMLYPVKKPPPPRKTVPPPMPKPTVATVNIAGPRPMPIPRFPSLGPLSGADVVAPSFAATATSNNLTSSPLPSTSSTAAVQVFPASTAKTSATRLAKYSLARPAKIPLPRSAKLPLPRATYPSSKPKNIPSAATATTSSTEVSSTASSLAGTRGFPAASADLSPIIVQGQAQAPSNFHARPPPRLVPPSHLFHTYTRPPMPRPRCMIATHRGSSLPTVRLLPPGLPRVTQSMTRSSRGVPIRFIPGRGCVLSAPPRAPALLPSIIRGSPRGSPTGGSSPSLFVPVQREVSSSNQDSSSPQRTQLSVFSIADSSSQSARTEPAPAFLAAAAGQAHAVQENIVDSSINNVPLVDELMDCSIGDSAGTDLSDAMP